MAGDDVAGRFTASDDARVFLSRLTRLDPAALVRLRPVPAPPAGGEERTALWARLPWGVLVNREVATPIGGDVTVNAAELLAVATAQLPPRRDQQWRWPLPPGPGRVVEEIPARELREVAAAAAGTLREVSTRGLQGRAVGSRVVREALLDHVPILVEPVAAADGADRVEISQRLVQGVLRMGFLGAAGEPSAGAEPAVRVRCVDRWVGLAARFGTAWLPPAAGPLTLRPVGG